ncbi:MAG: response regulator transcription factor [Firmicutes bacterium]|nr:response regulator transcription factor [Bacillota bacterium]
MAYKILIAEDDRDIIELLALYLGGEGFEILAAENGKDALAIAQKEDISAALVDIMMPVMNGFEFIKQLRTFSQIPVIVLSARDLDQDRILGLNIGADAYLTKPFNPLEVVAYVKSAIRRWENSKVRVEEDAGKVVIGELELDQERFTLRKNGVPVQLTSSELKIIAKMMKAPERVFTKAQLYECINGEFYNSDDNTMMVHISNLRAKIEDDPSHPRYIKTVRGLGYKIENGKETAQ